MSAEKMAVAEGPYRAIALYERELSGRGESPVARQSMPILLAFGAIGGVVFGSTGGDDCSVIDVFLGYLSFLPSQWPSFGQDLAAGNAPNSSWNAWVGPIACICRQPQPGRCKLPPVQLWPKPRMHRRHLSHFRTE
jgi:hypothetical protein